MVRLAIDKEEAAALLRDIESIMYNYGADVAQTINKYRTLWELKMTLDMAIFKSELEDR
jgi:hypothetical protein